jgi:hypothetical protein
MTGEVSYAVFFKTHFWDEFAARQYARLCARVGRGDVFVVFDATFGAAPDDIPGRVIEVTIADLAALELPAVTTHGSIIWYNPDYPNYAARAKLPAYDYYVSVEYDVVLNADLDALIVKLSDDRIDYLGFELRTKVRNWPWFDLHKDLYGEDMLACLSCLSIFSARAMDVLLARRQAAGRDFAHGTLRYWPNNEAFIPNEIRRAGLKQAMLGDYGGTRLYDWWPPTNEADLPAAKSEAFIHPVLHGTRFIRSTLFHEPSFFALLRPGSVVWRKLAGFDPVVVRSMVAAEIRRRVRAKMERMAAHAGLRPQWFAGATSGAVPDGQQPTAHNAG